MAGRKKNSVIPEINKRVTLVINKILAGFTPTQIIEYVNSEHVEAGNVVHEPWNFHPRTVYDYIAKANEFIKKEAEIDRNREIGLAISRYEDLYKENFQRGNYAECRNLIKEKSALLGLPEAQRVDITSAGQSINKYESMTHEDLTKLAEDMGYVRKA